MLNIPVFGPPLKPKGSYVVPFWVCYSVFVRDYNLLPQKELYWRFWVGFKVSG